LRERFEQGEIDIDPDDDKLAAQLDQVGHRLTGPHQDRIEGRHAQARPAITRPGRRVCDRIRWQG
jgi:hypothetical protein